MNMSTEGGKCCNQGGFMSGTLKRVMAKLVAAAVKAAWKRFFFVTQGPFSLIHLQRNIWKLIMDSHSAAEEQSNLGASDNFLTKPNGEEHSVEDIRDAEIKGKNHYCRPQEQ